MKIIKFFLLITSLYLSTQLTAAELPGAGAGHPDQRGHEDAADCSDDAAIQRLVADQDLGDLLFATCTGNLEKVDSLLLKGVSCDTKFPPTYDTPLMVAIKMDHIDIAHALLTRNADVNAKNKQEQTALMAASNKGLESLVTILLDAKADIDHQDAKGATALLAAVDKKHVSTIRTLLHKRANPNIPLYNGITPLVLSTIHPSKEIVTLLIASKADPSQKEKSGMNALGQAVMQININKKPKEKEYATIIKTLCLFSKECAYTIASLPGTLALTVNEKSSDGIATYKYTSRFTTAECMEILEEVEKEERELKQHAAILPPSYEQAVAAEEGKKPPAYKEI